jgi:hypothetical protein
MCCEAEFIEVQHQRQPLLALCVLERVAMRAGIVLRLETCPQVHGASWPLLEGLGRIYVERVDGLVRASAAHFAACFSARTVSKFRDLNSESQSVNADLANVLAIEGLALLPPFVWAQRLSPLPLLAEAAGLFLAPKGALEDPNVFVLRVVESPPKHNFLNTEHDDCLSFQNGDHLHAQATRLAAHDIALAAGLRCNSQEDGSPSLPHAGGALVRDLLAHSSLISAAVGLRKDLASVKAMLKVPAWDIPGGWKVKAALELSKLVHGTQALVPCSRGVGPRRDTSAEVMLKELDMVILGGFDGKVAHGRARRSSRSTIQAHRRRPRHARTVSGPSDSCPDGADRLAARRRRLSA